MSPTDHRHGTEAGHEQHLRDGEQPCAPCIDGKLRAARRRGKRKTMGYRYTLPIGDLHGVVVGWHDGGASLDDIALHIGLETSGVWRIISGSPDTIVYARTYQKLAANADEFPLTTVGVTRRIQALTWLGYSLPRIAEASGAHHDTILDARRGPREFVAQKVKRGVADAYERLHMRIPVGESKHDKAGITRVRNAARKAGYLPPLAWTHIDDARECPKGWEYRGTAAAWIVEDYEFLRQEGYPRWAVAERMGITQKRLEKALERRAS